MKINSLQVTLQCAYNALPHMNNVEAAQVLAMIEELERRLAAEKCREDFLEFVQHMKPDYVVGAHHRRLARLLEDLAFGRKDRIAVSIPPRHGKSELISVYFPAWFLGKFPDKSIIMTSHTGDLAVDFGRKVRNIVDSDEFKAIFANVTLATDSKSAGRWNTNHGGSYFACGVGAALAGRGADVTLTDDPFSEQDILNGNYEVFQRVYEWYTYGLRTRLMRQGRMAVVHTRWHPEDLIGRLIKDGAKNEGADTYEVFEFPAIFNENTPDEKALWPEFFDLDALKRTRASMPRFQWNAQFQQSPIAEEGAIVPRERWQQWVKDDPPECEYIIMALDAATETHNRADFTAITVWGVWFNDETDRNELLLLEAIKRRVEFPELKKLCLDMYEEWEPDSFIVEKKSAGVQIYQELRRMGMSVTEFTPHRGTGDKVARLNAVADLFADGIVWAPQTRWAEEVIEEMAAFPASPNDDLVDTCSMALTRFRQGGFLTLSTDEKETDYELPARNIEYY